MNIAYWKLFADVAELGSLTKVAASRNMAQSAISRQIAALETFCGGRLFHRTGRGVTLTEAGAAVFPRVKAWLGEAEQISRDVKAKVGVPAGVVQVGMIPSAGHQLASTLFQETRRQFPEVRLRFLDGASSQVGEWLETGQVDIGVLFRDGSERRSDEHPLATVDAFLVGPVGDPLTKSPTIPFSRLDRLPLVLARLPNSLRRVIDQEAKRKRIELSVLMECDSLEIQRDVVADGAAYGIHGSLAVIHDLDTGRLQASRIVSPEIRRTITLAVSRYRPPTLACRSVARLIRSCVEQMGKSPVGSTVDSQMVKFPGASFAPAETDGEAGSKP
jgi:DNA-binding transcriptional LysR family regulator